MGNIGEWLGLIIVVAILFNGGSGIFGGGNTQAEIQAAINNQSTQNGLRDVLLSSANNNYEVSQRINDQTMALMQQGYAYQLSAEGRYNQIQQQIAQLGYQIGNCCCEIKSTLLQDKYDAALRELSKAQNEAINAAQSQYLLGQLGKWVANPAAAA